MHIGFQVFVVTSRILEVLLMFFTSEILLCISWMSGLPKNLPECLPHCNWLTGAVHCKPNFSWLSGGRWNIPLFTWSSLSFVLSLFPPLLLPVLSPFSPLLPLVSWPLPFLAPFCFSLLSPLWCLVIIICSFTSNKLDIFIPDYMVIMERSCSPNKFPPSQTGLPPLVNFPVWTHPMGTGAQILIEASIRAILHGVKNFRAPPLWLKYLCLSNLCDDSSRTTRGLPTVFGFIATKCGSSTCMATSRGPCGFSSTSSTRFGYGWRGADFSTSPSMGATKSSLA